MPEFFDLPKGYSGGPVAEAPKSTLDQIVDLVPGLRGTMTQQREDAGKSIKQNVRDAAVGGIEQGAWLLPGPMGRAATAGAAKLGLPALAQRLAAPAARVATGAGIGGAEAGAKGEPVGGGAAMGALGAGAAEGLGKALEVSFQQLAAPWIRKAAKAAFEAKGGDDAATFDAARKMADGMKVSEMAHRMGQLIPELSVFGKDDLFAMARGSEGKAAMDRAFKSAKTEIEKRVGGGLLQVPELSDAPVTFENALRLLSEQGSGIGKAASLDRSARQAGASFDYGAARERIVSELNRLDAGGQAGSIFDSAMKVRSAARAYMTLLSKSMDPSGGVDPTKLLANFNKIAGVLERKMGPYYEQAESILLQGQSAPAKIPAKAKAPKTNYEPQGRLEMMVQGPEVSKVGPVPTRLPEGVKAAGSAAGALNPAYSTGLTALVAEALRGLNPMHRRRSGPDESLLEN